MQLPSVGRLVHVSKAGRRVPGVIVHVWGTTCVNVMLFTEGSEIVCSSSYQEEDDASLNQQPNFIGIDHNSWTWPPYVGPAPAPAPAADPTPASTPTAG